LNGLPYYKAYPRDFIEGTVGIPFEVKAAYRILLDIIYMRGGELPDDPRYISGVLGCSARAWNKYRQALLDIGKIRIENGIISNLRADKELEILRSFQEKQSENRSRSNKNNDLESPRFDQPEPEPEPRKPNGFPTREARKRNGFVKQRTAVDAALGYIERLEQRHEQAGQNSDGQTLGHDVQLLPAILGGGR
jgi:uncharacterized protein YdaU (DUF1376 family)